MCDYKKKCDCDAYEICWEVDSCEPSKKYNSGPNVNMAFAKIKSLGQPVHFPVESDHVVDVDESVSNSGIAKVVRTHVGRYRVYFKKGLFCRSPDKRPPVVTITPCESNFLPIPLHSRNEPDPPTLSELFPSENAVVRCANLTCKYVDIITGRAAFIPSITLPPRVTDDVDFFITAVQSNCE